jgi:translocation and assembly module TamA
MLLRRITIISLIALASGKLFALQIQVNISGVDAAIKKSIEADLNLYQAITEPKVTVARVQNLYDLAESQIQTTLQAKGYYNAQISQALKEVPGISADNNLWIADFKINLGPATTIYAVTINVTGPGQNDPRLKPLLKTPLLVPGKVLTHADYEATKERLLADINALGFLQAEFTQSVMQINRDTNEADIKFNLYTGKQYVFGKVKFIDGMYPDSLLKRYVPFKSGDPYELNKLMQFQENLEQADLYNKIRFDPQTNLQDPNDLTVPIDVRLVPKPRNRYTGSVGYGTDTGIRASAGWLHRRTQTPGHRVFSYVNYSSILHLAKINYIIPGKRPATDRYVLGVTGQEEFVEELYSRKGEIYGFSAFKRGKTETNYGINYFSETFHIVAANPNRTKMYLLPNARWIWVNSYEINPFEYGTRIEISVRGGIHGVLSSTSVIQVQGGLKQIWPIATKTRFIFRGNLGAVESEEFNSLPPSLRYFTGGDDTVRGFRYYAIGPRAIPGDPNSENIGGKYLVIASGELERNLYHELSGVVFFDSGNASMNFGGPLAMGAGFGVRYITPIGNFRCDLAKPLNTLTNKHWRVHITFGTDF